MNLRALQKYGTVEIRVLPMFRQVTVAQEALAAVLGAVNAFLVAFKGATIPVLEVEAGQSGFLERRSLVDGRLDVQEKEINDFMGSAAGLDEWNKYGNRHSLEVSVRHMVDTIR